MQHLLAHQVHLTLVAVVTYSFLIRFSRHRKALKPKGMYPKVNAPLAQLVEQLTLNQGVQGSSP